MITELPVYIGWDPKEMQAALVSEWSARLHSTIHLEVYRLALLWLRSQGYYTRPTETRDGHLWDVISEAPMSTEHAISRFFVPLLTGYKGWALFMDGDVLVRSDLRELVAEADPRYAVQVVKHPETIQGLQTKKDGQPQTQYARKWWSSVMLFNCEHPAHKYLPLHSLNTLRGRDLHRFCWLGDGEIGELSPPWNHLVGVSPESDSVKIAHYTLGIPKTSKGLLPFADEWWRIAKMAGYSERRDVSTGLGG